MKIWFEPLARDWHRGSDRSFAIVAASMLDELLEDLLAAHFIPQSIGSGDRLLSHNSPLGTFSARIDVCERLGLLSAQFCKDLHLVRKIRNYFAHSFEDHSFDDPSVSDRISELMRSCGILDRNPGIVGDYRDTKAGQFFLFACAAASMLAAYVRDDVEKFSQEGVEWIYTTSALFESE